MQQEKGVKSLGSRVNKRVRVKDDDVIMFKEDEQPVLQPVADSNINKKKKHN